MQAAGVNCVRMGEFGWSIIEPSEGHFQFETFDNAIDILAEHGIRTILGIKH
jgi:beta-galactosidase